MNAASMTGLDQQAHIGIHKWNSHGYIASVGKDEVGVLTELFDE